MSTVAQSIPLGAREVERELANIWSVVLDIPARSIDPDAHFFALGGDSLLILRVADEVRSRFFSTRPDDAPGVPDYFSCGTLRSLAARLQQAWDMRAAPCVETDDHAESSVAVVGMACRFPGAPDPDAFWSNLREGVESTRVFLDSELLDAGATSPELQHAAYVKAGVLLEGLRLFDADYFGLTPREASLTSPEQRLVVECAEEALQDAGYGDTSHAPRIGVFVGSGLSTYLLELLAAQPGNLESSHGMSVIASNTCAAGRVSYLLNLVGPSVTLDTACSSSLVAVHEACRSILHGECEMALAGGATVRRFAPRGYMAEAGGIFSPDGHCRPFDQNAQGTVGSSGAGIVLLKRLKAAIADGDTIHAVIRGTAVNNDGGTKAGFTAPSAAGQASVIRAALTAARVPPDSIDYVETHGTATLLGDAIELRALADVFSVPGQTKHPALGALKANVGHMEAAAGIGGLIKTILVLKHRQIPPAIHFREWAAGASAPPFSLSAALTDVPSGARPMRAAVSSFGIGGTNAHAVLEEAPVAPRRFNSGGPELLVVSAHTEAALRTSCRNLVARLKDANTEELADIAYTLQVGRKQFGVRTHVVAASATDAAQALESAVQSSRAQHTPVVFMFPDESAMYPRMGLSLYDSEPRFGVFLDEMDELLQSLTGESVLNILRSSSDDLAPDEWGQAALFAVEYSLGRLWNAWGVVPSKVFGRGVGKYVAACFTGLLTPEDALKSVIARARGEKYVPLSGPTARELSDAQACITVECAPCGDNAINERGALLSALGRVWECGVAVDWHAVNVASSLRRVPLPVYPFERREHWALSAPPSAPATPAVPERLEMSEWFSMPTWEQRPALPRSSRAESSGRCVFVGSWPELEAQVRDFGTHVVCVSHTSQLAAVLEGTSSTCIVHCAEVSSAVDADERPDDELLESGLYGLLDLCTTLASVRCRPGRLVVLTRGAHSVAGDPAASPRRAMLTPAIEVIGREFPDIACRTIDIPHTWPAGHAGQHAFRALVDEICASSDDALIALRGGRRWARTCRPAALSSVLDADLPLRARGVYLITGGTGGIGGTLAKFLAQQFSARLILTARSAFADSEIKSLEAAGAQVITASADVASLEDMARVVDLAVREYGRLDGVIHAAGVSGTGVLHQKTRESVRTVLKPKVMGTWALYEACKSQNLDFFVCCSSVASAIAPAGWYEYSAANAFQDAFCEAHDGRTATRFLSIGWDRWKDVGMAARILTDSDPDAISPAEGIEVFRRALAAGGGRWVISTRGLQRLRESAGRTDAPASSAVEARPPGAIQTELTRIWKDLLGVAPAATSDDFFVLGGDSLAAVNLHTRLQEQFGRAPSLRQLLSDSTIGGMAQILREMATCDSAQTCSLAPVTPHGEHSSRP